MPFEPTLPADAPDLERASAFEDYLEVVRQRGRALHRPAALGARPPGTMSASLWQDLRPAGHLLRGRAAAADDGAHGNARGEAGGDARGDARGEAGGHAHGAPAAPAWRDVLEVVAASRRHARALAAYLRCGERVVPLTLFPQERLAHCPMRLEQFAAMRLDRLRVLHVEPALLRPPGHAEALRVAERAHYAPLAAMSWLLALHGPRSEVLPGLAGSRACRIVPGLELATPGVCGAMAAALQRLAGQAASLRTIAGWPGMDAARAARLVNGLYLQGALIVSRTHPAAHAG